MLSDSLLGGSSSLFGLNFLGSVLGSLMYVVLFLFLGLILYYYTGEKKKADEFMPRLMGVAIRLNSHMWTLVSSVAVFVGLYSVFFYLLDNMLPGDNAATDTEAIGLVKGLVIALVGLIWLTVHYMFSSMVQNAEEKKGTVATKYMLSLGMAAFGIIFFVATIDTVSNWVDKIYDETDYISASSIAVMLASGLVWGAYVMKSFKVQKHEK